MLLLKQSTTVTIKLGPFVDATDGVTEETGITLNYVQVSKNGGSFGARSSGTAPTHDADGWYDVELDATDTGTLGRLQLKAQDPAVHLPVFQEFMVIPAEPYDTLVAGSDALTVDLSATAKTDVNAEVSDVLKTDTISELAADPGTTPTFEDALMLLYMALRNKATASNTQQTIANAAGTTVLTASLSDSAGITTKGKFS